MDDVKFKKYKLNVLRYITGGKIPDTILKKAFDFRVTDGIFNFKVKMKVDTSEWKGVYGTAK